MIKYIFIVYPIIIMCFSCCLASEFREAEWGMSREQVKQLEKTEPVFPGDDTLRPGCADEHGKKNKNSNSLHTCTSVGLDYTL